MVLLCRGVAEWIKGIDTGEMLKTVHDERCYFNTKCRSWQKEAAATRGWLTRLVIRTRVKERKQKKKKTKGKVKKEAK